MGKEVTTSAEQVFYLLCNLLLPEGFPKPMAATAGSCLVLQIFLLQGDSPMVFPTSELENLTFQPLRLLSQAGHHVCLR